MTGGNKTVPQITALTAGIQKIKSNNFTWIPFFLRAFQQMCVSLFVGADAGATLCQCVGICAL